MQFFKSLSLKSKLLLTIVFTFFILSIVTAYLIQTQFKLSRLQDEGASRFKDAERVAKIHLEVVGLYSIGADAIINRNIDDFKLQIPKMRNSYDENIKNLESIVDTKEETEKLQDFKIKYDNYLKLFESDLLNEVSKSAPDINQLKEIDGKIDEARDLSLVPLSEIYNSIENEASESDSHFDQTAKDGIKISLILSLIGLILSFILFWIITSKLSTTLTAIANELKNSGASVSSAAVQIASTSEELSQSTTEQAASLQETSSSIEEINSMVCNNSENAKKSNLISQQSLELTEKGKSVVKKMLEAIQDISQSNMTIETQTKEMTEEIQNITAIIMQIENKTKVINDIVFQTKLLAFNASVEAARAGEQGKGFAVVAEEVGNLASMSGGAAADISKMLEESVSKVNLIVSNSNHKMTSLITDNKSKVNAGINISNECSDVLESIVLSVANVSSMINEISNASHEQSQGVQEVTKAISQLDVVTQQNSSVSQDSANAAHTLAKQSEKLKELVLTLVKTIEGENRVS